VASISNAVLSVVRRYRFSEEVFRVVESAGCAPLLGRYDRIIEYDRQRPAYAELSPSVLEKGHVTGSLATDRLREHVLHVLSARDAGPVGRGSVSSSR
jgi:hypothetical protein